VGSGSGAGSVLPGRKDPDPILMVSDPQHVSHVYSYLIPGEYTMEYCRYSPAKQETQEKIIKEYQAKLEEGNPQKAAGKKKKN